MGISEYCRDISVIEPKVEETIMVSKSTIFRQWLPFHGFENSFN